MFGYVKRSKILDIIESERRKVVEDIDFLYDIRKVKIASETNEDKNNYYNKSAVLQGKHDILVKLTEQIVRDGM